MKTFKKLSAIILAIVLLFGSMPMAELGLEGLFTPKASAASQQEEGKDYNNFVYTYTNGNRGIKIIKYMGADKHITVPDFIENLPVTELDSYSFSPTAYNNYKNPDCLYIETVTLPDSIITIGDNAFLNCRYLYGVNVPSELKTICDKAFMNCYSLSSIDLSGDLFELGADAFNGTAIKKLDIGSKNRPYYMNIYKNFLRGSNVEEFTITSEYITFYSNSLANDSLKTVTINATVDTFESDVFGDAKTAKLPETVNMYNSFDAEVYSVLEKIYGYSNEVSDDDENWITFTRTGSAREILTEGDYQYYINKNGEAVISSYSGTDTDVTVPETLGGFTVTTIGYRAFAICKSITSVTLPDTVEHIQSRAFTSCENMTEINVGSGVKIIGFGAFYKCSSLPSISLPETVGTIAGYTFCNCKKLKSIQAPGVTKALTSAFEYSRISEIEFSEKFYYVESNAFGDCFYLEEFKYDKNITYFGEYAFFNTDIEEFEFNDAITEIPQCTFYDNIKLVSVVLPPNLEKIGADAFHNCYRLENMVLPATVTTIGSEAFRSCRSLSGTLTITEKITLIGHYAFMETGYDTLNYNSPSAYNTAAFVDSKISVINFGNNVTEIPSNIFRYCEEIKHITLSDTVTKIGSRAFEDCINLESIKLSSNLAVIGDFAFSGCKNLTSISLPESITEIGQDAFAYCDKITELTIPENLKSIYVDSLPPNLTMVYYNAENCTFEDLILAESENTYYSPFYQTKVKNVFIGDTVKRIPEYFLCSVSFIENIVLPDSVTEIGAEAFRGSSIKNITLPPNLIVIEDRAFYGTNVKIEGNKFPDKLRMIGKEAFAYCYDIEEIYLPDSVIDVAESAFEYCEKLSKVRMSPNVRLIAARAFYGCLALSDFIWNSDIKLISDKSFYNCRALKSFDFTGVEFLYPNSFMYTGVTLVTLGEDKNEEATNLISIETQSFKGCENLDTVAIGGNVTTIKSEAFASCSNLETAVISDSVVNIATNAFDNCDSLTIYCEEDSYAHKYAVKNNIPVSTFVVAPIPNQTYTGSEIEPEIDVSVSGEKVMENTDFTVKYSNNINVGTAKVTVSGKGIYKVLSSIANFTIITKNISPVTFADISEQNYTGEAVMPTVTVTDGNMILNEGVDYTVEYSNNVDAGTATATIRGIGNYHGTASVNFEIKDLPVFERIINAITDFFASLSARIIAFFNSIFG